MEEQCFYQDVQCVIVKKSKFLEEQEARRLLSDLLGVKVPILYDIPIANTLF